MDKKKNIVILVLVFVLLIGGASVLYTQLGKNGAPDQLQIQGGLGDRGRTAVDKGARFHCL